MVRNLTLEWRHHYEGNYEEKHDEYYRLWRGIWAENDKPVNLSVAESSLRHYSRLLRVLL